MKLQDKAMLVRLSISQWTARKLDKRVSKEVNTKYGAAQDAGRYNKVLIAQEEIKKISKIANEARTFHYENTLPWCDDGGRILPAANYLQYTQKIREFRSKFDGAVSIFCDNYLDFVEDAKRRLNGLFVAGDYPVPDKLLSRYDFSVEVTPIPAACDFRVSLQSEEVEQIKNEIETKANRATREAMADLWRRLYKAVSHMADRLIDKDAVFRNSLVTNLCELAELLPRLNVTGDPDLERMRREVENKLCQTEPDLLRVDDGERHKTAMAARSIMDAMSGYMGGAA